MRKILLETVKQKLHAYCNRYDANFDGFIHQHEIDIYFDDQDMSMKFGHMIQKLRNSALLLCMKQLRDVCNKNEIRHVFIKGLLLAEELYYPRELRPISDIDILIEYYNLRPLLKLLKEFGYTTKNGAEFDIDEVMRYGDNGGLHILPIYTTCNVYNQTIPIMVEIHFTPVTRVYRCFGNTDNDYSYTSFAIDRAMTTMIDNESFMIPSLEDNVYILSMHFLSHFFIDPLMYFYIKKPFCQKPMLRRSIDVALLLMKHEDKLNWGRIGEIFERYGNAENLEYLTFFMNEVYGDICPSYTLPVGFIHQHKPLYDICSVIRNIDPSEYLIRDALKQNLDRVVRDNIRNMTSFMPDGATVSSDKNGIALSMSMNICYGRYVLDLYDPNGDDKSLCMEYVIDISEDNVTVFVDDGYSILWEVATYGKHNEHELMVSYAPIDPVVTVSDDYIEIMFNGNEQVKAVMVGTEVVNPFITKRFV